MCTIASNRAAVRANLQRVGGLAGLADEDAGVIAEDGAAAVAQVRGQLQRDGDVGQLLHRLPGGQAGVERGAARDEDDAPPAFDGRQVVGQAAQLDVPLRPRVTVCALQTPCTALWANVQTDVVDSYGAGGN